MANLIDLDIESRNTETHRLNNKLEKTANITENEIERNRKEIVSQRSLSTGQCVESESVKSTLTQSPYARNILNVNEGHIDKGTTISNIAASSELEAHELQIKELQAILLEEMSSTIEVTQSFQQIIASLELQVTSKSTDMEIMKSNFEEQNLANERKIEQHKIENTSLRSKLEDMKTNLSSSQSEVDKLRREISLLQKEILTLNESVEDKDDQSKTLELQLDGSMSKKMSYSLLEQPIDTISPLSKSELCERDSTSHQHNTTHNPDNTESIVDLSTVESNTKSSQLELEAMNLSR
jgi:hypothetical protein